MTHESTETSGTAVYLRERGSGRVHRAAHFDLGEGDVDPIRGTIESLLDISDVDPDSLCPFCWSASERATRR